MQKQKQRKQQNNCNCKPKQQQQQLQVFATTTTNLKYILIGSSCHGYEFRAGESRKLATTTFKIPTTRWKPQ